MAKYLGSSSPHPMYGLDRGFSVADIPSGSNTPYIQVPELTNVSVPAKSLPQNPGARYITVAVALTNGQTMCNVDLYSTDGTNDVLLQSQAISQGHTDVYFGNYENIDLQGGEFKIGLSNFVNAANVSVSYRVNG